MTSCFVLMVRWLLGFGVTNLFETLEDDIGIDITYWIFAGICGIGKLHQHKLLFKYLRNRID